MQDAFNAITVDSDTSTSDTLMLFATGAAEARRAAHQARRDRRLADFRRRSTRVLLDLAQQVVRDGEGARNFIGRR